MSNPQIHAMSSARRYGGLWNEYADIHLFMDSTKSITADNRHRYLLHNTWAVQNILPKVFGEFLTNSEGKVVSVIQIGIDHLQEDYKGYCPTPEDWIGEMPFADWMQNGIAPPPSAKQIIARKDKRKAYLG